MRDGDVTWAWIEQELDRGQDVEVMTATHWVVLEGKLSWGSTHIVSYRDDNYQHGAATTDAEKAELAKRHTPTYMKEEADGLHTNIGNGDEVILTAFSESPAPVGGIVELLVDGSDVPASAAQGSGSSAAPYAAIPGAAAAVVALAAGAWYARRRWLG